VRGRYPGDLERYTKHGVARADEQNQARSPAAEEGIRPLGLPSSCGIGRCQPERLLLEVEEGDAGDDIRPVTEIGKPVAEIGKKDGQIGAPEPAQHLRSLPPTCVIVLSTLYALDRCGWGRT
jgi:hypothetical protein